MSWSRCSRRPSLLYSTQRRSMSGSSWLLIGDSSLHPSSLGPRVGGVVHGTQALSADVSVTLRRREIGVTQQLLHRPQVRTAVEQVRGEGVAQCVGMGGRRRPAV